jgi:DNA-binding NarL/FixJ family response regulator
LGARQQAFKGDSNRKRLKTAETVCDTLSPTVNERSVGRTPPPRHPPAGKPKPRILLADDNAYVLAHVSRLLEVRFDVVAAVNDGWQAVRAARRWDPDVVLLDITMPQLNGFQVALELTRAGSRAKILMLTMHQSDDFVAAAITAGARGYVLKSRLSGDLTAAIDHVIAGRLFVPSLTSLLSIAPAPDANGHAAQLCITEGAGVTELSSVLAAALDRGEVAAIMATEATRAAIAERLDARGARVAQAAARGRYLSLDATSAVSEVMTGGRPETRDVAAFVDELDRARLAASASSLTIVGEPALLLCRAGDLEGAIHLETVWHDVTRRRPFHTVCPCLMECFSEGNARDRFPDICAPHSAVCHAVGD